MERDGHKIDMIIFLNHKQHEPIRTYYPVSFLKTGDIPDN